jgi:hypothetical protein
VLCKQQIHSSSRSSSNSSSSMQSKLMVGNWGMQVVIGISAERTTQQQQLLTTHPVQLCHQHSFVVLRLQPPLDCRPALCPTIMM